VSKVLLAGVETVVGGNLAICLAKTQLVTSVCLSEPVTITGCDVECLTAQTPQAVSELIGRVRPQRIIYCGAGSQLAWGETEPRDADVRQATTWINAAQHAQTQLTLISSSAVFTGPWMFHSESSQSFCPSAPAQALLEIEKTAAETCPDSLIIRTHAVGWQPGGKTGWIESLLGQLEQGKSSHLDCCRHASPILASDLADIICRAWTAGLSGLYHIAGAERANPVQLARRLAHHFQLPIPDATMTESLVDRPCGFGCGETSLQTRKIRRALHVSLPMLEESVLRLFQQHVDGYRTRLTGHSVIPGSRVA
jgi:dTDP-4-dehydrorhamnose reductase